MIRRYTVLLGFVFAFAALLPPSAFGQDNQDNQPHIQPRDAAPPRPGRPAQAKPTPLPTDDDEQGPGESSSQDSQIDLNLRPLVKNKETLDETITEGPFDPHRAAKDIEVGNYYLKQKNYRAALDRFHDALLYKPGDAEAIYGLAVTQEKLDLPTQAYKNYRKYLQILPNGPTSREAQEAVKRLTPQASPVAVESDDAREAARNLAAGEACLADNRYDDARQQFEQAARLTPENPVVYFRLGQSLRGMQRLDPARQNYQKYLQLQPDGPFAADAKKAINDIAGIIGK
jgi:tetratricopeptide (TPR) repeat protein